MEPWSNRELPALRALVEHFDDLDARNCDVEAIAIATGLHPDEVKVALRNLHGAIPPYVEAWGPEEVQYPVFVSGVTERARREVGQWPSGVQLIEELVRGLNEAAEREPDPEKKGKIRQTANLIGGSVREIGVEVAASALSRLMGVQ